MLESHMFSLGLETVIFGVNGAIQISLHMRKWI